MSSPARYTSFQQIHTAVRTLNTSRPLELALADLDHADPLALRAFQRMQDARAGLPGAQAYDAPSVTGGSAELTQPERLADRIDRTQNDRDLLDTTLNRLWFLVRPDGLTIDTDRVDADITSCCLTLRKLIDAWTPRPATDTERRAIRQANVQATECALTREHLNLWAQPVATSNLYGLLPDPVPVCLWVRRFARDRKRLPTPKEWQAHASQDDELRKQLIASVR